MRKPTLIYGLTALLIFITSFFDFGSIDIVEHDTYFVIANSHLLKFLSLYYTFMAFITWIVFKLGRAE
jgi:heme/copper-type cytochrome/quinol oxidase subunit 1